MDATGQPAEFALFLHQIDIETLTREGERRVHTRYPTADHQGRLGDIEKLGLERLGQTHPGDRPTHEVDRFLRRLFGLLAVHPGAVIADVGHLEEIAVQSDLADVLLEELLVRAGRARRHHHPVERVLLNAFLDLGQRVLRAGVEQVFRVGHAGEILRCFRHRGYVHGAGDVRPARADEYTHPGLLGAHVALLGILLGRNHRAARLAQLPAGQGRGCRSLHHGLGNVLGGLEGAADEDPRAGRCQRLILGRLCKAVLVEFEADAIGQLADFLGHLQANREDDQIELLLDRLPILALMLDPEVVRLRILFHRGHPRADVANAALLLRPDHEFFEVLAVGAEVHPVDRDFRFRAVLLGQDGLLGGVGAADR